MILTIVQNSFFLHSGSHSIKGLEFIMLDLAKGIMGIDGSVLLFSKEKKLVTLKYEG